MSEQSTRWRRAVPVAALAAVTVAGLASAPTASAAPPAPSPSKGSPTATAAPNLDRGCTLSPSLTVKSSDQASCIGVGATLDHVPALGQTATLSITVKTGRAEKGTAVTVDLPSTLAFADGTPTRAAVTGAGASQRASIATTDLAQGATKTYTRTVKAVATGFGEVAVRATSVVDKSRTDAGADYVHLTVGKDATTTHAGAAAATGDLATVATSAKVVDNRPARPEVALPSNSVNGTQVAARPATPGTSCATGYWVFQDQTGATVGAWDSVVQIWRSGTQIAGGYAGGDGSYNICWSTGGAAQTVNVRFVESNNVWKVVNNAGNDYAYVSGTQTIADGATGNFGTLQPADGTQHRALHANFDYAAEYNWMYQSSGTATTGCWSPYGSSCYQLVVHWQSDSTTGTFWNTSGVYLLAASPDSEDEPVHEGGHALMYALYGNSFPSTTNCSPHYLFTISSTTCGWTEGWADWIDTSVWSNTVYTFASGGTSEFNVTWGSGGDTGDQVEGRIVQALDSLNDGVKYPFDNISGNGYRYATDNFNVLRTYKPNTFADYWNGRAAGGYDVSQAALSALYQGTIDYGFRNPLTDGTPKSLPQAVPAHNYSFTTTRGYWSAVAVRPADGSDADVTLYNDAAQGTALGSSSYGGSTTDFVAINSNSGARPLQTYYPRVTQFAGSGGYTIEGVQGFSTFSSGTLSVTTGSGVPINIMDSNQTAGVPVYFRAVPNNGQSVSLSFMQPGQTIVSRSGATSSGIGNPGQEESISVTPSASGYGGLLLTNQGMQAGTVTLYADTTAPAGGSIAVAGGAATTSSLNPTVNITLPTDAETGVVSMQLSTDGTFDTEPVVPAATTATVALSGANNNKTVYARFLNGAGMWSTPISDTIALRAAPAVSSLTVTEGPVLGNNTIAITGVRFSGTTQVLFGTVAATTYTVVNDGRISVKVPAGAVGAVHVRVTNGFGQSPAVTPDVYRYRAKPVVTELSRDSGPAAGGTTVVISGTAFTGATSVSFGSVVITDITILSDSRIRVVTTAQAAGQVDVRVTTAGGISATSKNDKFRFRPGA